MNRKTTVALVAAGLIAATSAMAMNTQGFNHGFGKHSGMHHKGKSFGLNLDRELNADQIRTLAEAHLIMQGNPNVRVDEVKPMENGYTVTIVTQDNSLVEELKLAKNGMLQERYERIQQYRAERDERMLQRRADCDETYAQERRGYRQHGGRKGKRGMELRKQMAGRFAEHMDREFSADQIRTLTEARLIMRGNPNIKVGEVNATADGYKVIIFTLDNSLVEEWELAKNAMPQDRFEHMKQRMERREMRQGNR